MIFFILEQSMIALPLLIGAYLILSLLKLPDFSLESAYLFGAVSAFLAQDLPFPCILISAVLGGMCVGLVVSFLNQMLGLPFLLAAIATNGLFHGAVQYFLGGGIATVHLHFPIPEFFFLAGNSLFFLCLLPFFLRSQLGYSFAIYGNNPRFFDHYPISGRYLLFSGVTLGHGLAGMSGFLFAQSSGFVDLNMHVGIILLCLTSLILGKLCVHTRLPHLGIPFLGIFAYFCMQQTLLALGLNLKYFNAFQALFILSILAIGYQKKTVTLDHLGV